jgi:hypothetical protein
MPADPRFTPQWDKPLVENEQTMFRGVLKRIIQATGSKILNFTFNSVSGVVTIEMRLDHNGAKKAAAKLSTYVNTLPTDYPNYDAVVKMIKEERKLYRSYVTKMRKIMQNSEKNKFE